ncbi:hypothetical protein BCR43DRAFT_498318 [Syncephalastrum racemosum]|uniref:WWE domain-containing protein n=1 Tax=Syncephalastrum racemosum TaxID=13706 RepID=A0A1X2H0N3_SYNRA|nr:hypothetical protein BCR43DRAFT_498318 [Syncephalastrum racemosum]
MSAYSELSPVHYQQRHRHRGNNGDTFAGVFPPTTRPGGLREEYYPAHQDTNVISSGSSSSSSSSNASDGMISAAPYYSSSVPTSTVPLTIPKKSIHLAMSDRGQYPFPMSDPTPTFSSSATLAENTMPSAGTAIASASASATASSFSASRQAPPPPIPPSSASASTSLLRHISPTQPINVPNSNSSNRSNHAATLNGTSPSSPPARSYFTWLVFLQEQWVPFDAPNQIKLEQTLSLGGTFVDVSDTHFPKVKRVRVFPKNNYLSYLGVKYRLSRIMQPDAWLDHVPAVEHDK